MSTFFPQHPKNYLLKKRNSVSNTDKTSKLSKAFMAWNCLKYLCIMVCPFHYLQSLMIIS